MAHSEVGDHGSDGLTVQIGAGTDIIRAEGVTKRFGALLAVDHVDYALREHEVAGLIGSNGAGKTTFFNLLTGYYPPDAGTIRYKDEDVTHMTPQERVARGIMRTFQLASTFDTLTVTDNIVLSFFRAHHPSSLRRLFFNTRRRHREHEKVLEILDTFALGAERDKEVKHLSLGEKRRLEIAMAVIADPDVLLLDEPLAGLADSEIGGILDVLGRRIGTQTILIVEHKISHVKDFVQRFTVMHEGRIIADGDYGACMRHPDVRRSYWQIDAGADGDGHAG